MILFGGLIQSQIHPMGTFSFTFLGFGTAYDEH